MFGPQRRLGIAVLLGLLFTAPAAEPLWGQEPAGPQAQPETNAAAAAEMESDDTSKEAPLREQTIYVPYSKLRSVFEKEGRGVFLPYEKFQELWKAAQNAERRDPEPRPPVDALITEIRSLATVRSDALQVEAELKIDVLREGWHQVPLRLADAAIRQATLDNEPARLVRDAQGGYAVLVERASGDARTTFALKLEYAKAIQQSPGKNSVSVQAPQAPVNRWEVHIPEAGVKIDIHPLIAATQPPADNTTADASETVVIAFVGAAESIAIDWNPKAEGASGLDALVSVQAEQEVTIDEGVVRTRSRLTYQVSRSELGELRLQVPADQKVAAVYDPNVRQWEVKTEGDVQQIVVQLFEPATDAQHVTIELERFLPEDRQAQIDVPVVQAIDVSRQQGFVVLRVVSTLRWNAVQRSGLLQLDAAELPASLSAESWDAIFRYAALPFQLVLDVEKVEPRIRVEEFVHAYLKPDQLTHDLLAIYNIERAGVFQLSLDIDAQYEIRQIRGYTADGIQPAAVDTWHADPQQPGRWQVNLANKAQGRVGLLVQLTRPLSDPNLASPTGTASSLALPLARVAPDGVEQASGKVVVFAPESLRVTSSTQSGAQNISFREATEQVPDLRRGDRFGEMKEVMALSYAREQVDLQLAIERRKPQVIARQLLVATIESGVVRYEARFVFDVRYSPVKSLRVDVPLNISSLVRNETSAVREQLLQPAPADVPDGYVAWQFSGETELLGEVPIHLAWQQNLDPLGIGDSIELQVPRLRPAGVDRAWGQIVLAKSETIDIRPTGELDGLRPIDPQHDLLPGASIPTAARAFEFQQDWTLALTATRYQLVDVKRTSIEMALLRMVVTRSDQIDVHALYRLRSARQRLAVVFPERVDPQQSFDAQPLRINGQPVTLEKGDQQQYFIPLVGHATDAPLLLELRYTVTGNTGRLDFPVFPEEPAVGQVWLSAYIPEDRALVGTRGPWNLEQFNPWRISLTQSDARRHDGTSSDADLYGRLTAGIQIQGDPLHAFPVQGQRYLFSTLRPAEPPDGDLRLRTTDSRALDALLFLLAGVIAIVFLFRPLGEKLVAIGCALIATILAGVFWPTFSMYLLDGRFVLAAAAILLLWTTAELVKLFTFWRQQGRLLMSSMTTNGNLALAGSPAHGPPIEAATAPTDSSRTVEKEKGDKPEQGGANHA